MLDMLFPLFGSLGIAVFYSLYFIYDDYFINYFIDTGVWCRDVRLHGTVKRLEGLHLERTHQSKVMCTQLYSTLVCIIIHQNRQQAEFL